MGAVVIPAMAWQDAMIPHARHETLDIFRKHLAPALDQGEGLAGVSQVHGPSG